MRRPPQRPVDSAVWRPPPPPKRASRRRLARPGTPSQSRHRGLTGAGRTTAPATSKVRRSKSAALPVGRRQRGGARVARFVTPLAPPPRGARAGSGRGREQWRRWAARLASQPPGRYVGEERSRREPAPRRSLVHPRHTRGVRKAAGVCVKESGQALRQTDLPAGCSTFTWLSPKGFKKQNVRMSSHCCSHRVAPHSSAAVVPAPAAPARGRLPPAARGGRRSAG